MEKTGYADAHMEQAAGILHLLDPEGVTTVIDAGCGTGRITELLLDRVPAAHVIAVDGSQGALERAAERLAAPVAAGRVMLLHADLTRPLPISAPVDAVLSTATFHWIADHDALFATLAAALRPGGQLVAQCGGAGNMGGESWAGAMFATPHETTVRLTEHGFVNIQTWLDPRPAAANDYMRLNIVARRG